MEELYIIQQQLNVPKNQYNPFGKYNYRSCEDILMAVKPLLEANHCTLTLQDEVQNIGERIYVKATATLTNKDGKTFITQAYAREEETMKGMVASQITGATSSYARKYALNGMFAIDDNRDADATNTHGKEKTPKQAQTAVTDANLQKALQQIRAAKSIDELKKIYTAYPNLAKDSTFLTNMSSRKKQLI